MHRRRTAGAPSAQASPPAPSAGPRCRAQRSPCPTQHSAATGPCPAPPKDGAPGVKVAGEAVVGAARHVEEEVERPANGEGGQELGQAHNGQLAQPKLVGHLVDGRVRGRAAAGEKEAPARKKAELCSHF